MMYSIPIVQMRIACPRTARDEDEHQRQREKVIAEPEQEVAKRNHHFTATMPQKLYHLKKTST